MKQDIENKIFILAIKIFIKNKIYTAMSVVIPKICLVLTVASELS